MFKAIDLWLPGWVAAARRRPRLSGRTRHLAFCVADHFEPFRGEVSAAEALADVQSWLGDYARAVEGFRDAEGRGPRHSLFYPGDEYAAAVLDALAGFVRAGHGEVEIHLHHRGDTAAGLRDKLVQFRDTLAVRHGLLGRDRAGRPRFGFVHGNWALCNSRPDGDWCGVNEELHLLAESGCYADFTFPSAPSRTQPRIVNTLYYATDTPGRPRAHDRGVRMKTGRAPAGDLLLIQGPLALNWRRRKWGLLPRIENAELTEVNPPTPERLQLWIEQAIGVAGCPDLVVVKLHTHGCVPANRRMLLGDAMRRFHRHLADHYNDGTRWCLHYVTAREVYNLVRAAEAGVPGLPGSHRDFEILPPPA